MPEHIRREGTPGRFPTGWRLAVAVTSAQRAFRPDAAGIRRLARALLRDEGIQAAEISIALVDNAAIHGLNRRFLKHDEPTDVITFPLSDAGDAVLKGEIVVSADMALERALHFGHSAKAEVALYVVHGLLHLTGYDDRRLADRKRMRARERHYLRRLGIRLKGRVEE